jgi:heme/copper-type cytochrome/quinol oxidase subunit 2
MNYPKNIARLLILLILWAFPLAIFAACDPGALCNPISSSTFSDFANQILTIVIQIGYVVVVFFIVYSGFLFVSARGNEEQLKKAKTAITWTLIGAAILLGAKVLEVAIQTTVTSLQSS